MTPASSTTELFTIWSAARAEANLAYDAWCDAGPSLRVYRAAEDRADAAEHALQPAHRATGRLTAVVRRQPCDAHA